MSTEHPLFEIVTTTAGAISIRNKAVNEIMHNPVGPWIEANSLYIDQSKLKERLSESTAEELILFDIGLGAAANSLAALSCAHGIGKNIRPLRMISFEKDLELLKFALAHASQFPHIKTYEMTLQKLLADRHWSDKKISWELRVGDFLELIETEKHKPHLIFFDPYSPKMNQEMWTTSCFEKIRKKSRELAEGGTSLYTYSQATRVRAAMLKAGFFVGFGASTGLKLETTEAATARQFLKNPLSDAWYIRWLKSHERYPYDCKPEQRANFDAFMQKLSL